MWTCSLLILLPASSGGRELSRFEEEKNLETEAEVALEISWRAGSRVKRENKVSASYRNQILGPDIFNFNIIWTAGTFLPNFDFDQTSFDDNFSPFLLQWIYLHRTYSSGSDFLRSSQIHTSITITPVQQSYLWFSKVIHWCSKAIIHWCSNVIHRFSKVSKVFFGSTRLFTGSARLSVVQQGYHLWGRSKRDTIVSNIKVLLPAGETVWGPVDPHAWDHLQERAPG